MIKKVGTIHQKHVDLRFDTMLKASDILKLNKHDALNNAVMTAIMYLKLKNLKTLN